MSRQGFEELLLPIMKADQSAVTGTAEVALWPVSPWTATPANELSPGKVYRVTALGVLTSAASTPGNLTVTPRYGTSSSGVALGASAAAALTASKTNVPWYLEALAVCRADGAAGTLVLAGNIVCDQAGVSGLAFGGTVASVDTTTAQGIYIGVTLGSASDSMTCRFAGLESLS